ncbi:hypothetical protein COCOR_04697 [Corallococcus coralloides DSM 2259]|uniref:Lipoprotein n=1 Tax=Corallococcus coralloides (strain ATCC 25202 / DSM 2259 / NBRC 100086 / M2) TaxID=1144275 RepID=H8MJG7_CORCM|nr:hypothetical protein [Corallococcus coralloides]AFE05969.1 hypothetical protein COCOR_04697 [Corallococcus coralloides DSM 2259]
MITRWKSAVGRMAVGFAALSAAQAGAQQEKTQNTPVKLAPAKRLESPAAAKATGSVDVAVDEGARGTRMYRYDRSSGKLTLVKQLTQKEAASTTAGFKALSSVEAGGGTALVDPDRGGAVAPEGKPPKGGGPPGGHDPGLTQTDLANINRELGSLKLNKAQVKIATQAQR